MSETQKPLEALIETTRNSVIPVSANDFTRKLGEYCSQIQTMEEMTQFLNFLNQLSNGDVGDLVETTVGNFTSYKIPPEDIVFKPEDRLSVRWEEEYSSFSLAYKSFFDQVKGNTGRDEYCAHLSISANTHQIFYRNKVPENFPDLGLRRQRLFEKVRSKVINRLTIEPKGSSDKLLELPLFYVEK